MKTLKRGKKNGGRGKKQDLKEKTREGNDQNLLAKLFVTRKLNFYR
jgi:hypothetical protein